MKIAFTHDFRGPWTQEQFYLTGTELDVDEETGAELIALGHAVAVEEVEEAEDEKPKSRSRGKRK